MVRGEALKQVLGCMEILLCGKERAVGDVWILRYTEPVIFCFPWTLSKGFQKGRVADFFLGYLVAEAVEAQYSERAEGIHA